MISYKTPKKSNFGVRVKNRDYTKCLVGKVIKVSSRNESETNTLASPELVAL